MNNFDFSLWSVERKMESLRLMDTCIRDKGSMIGRDTIWQTHGAGLCDTPEKTEAKRREIASSDEKYINALFCFYICMTTDLSWFNP